MVLFAHKPTTTYAKPKISILSVLDVLAKNKYAIVDL